MVTLSDAILAINPKAEFEYEDIDNNNMDNWDDGSDDDFDDGGFAEDMGF